MKRLLDFNTAVILVVVMGGLAFINRANDEQPQWSPAFAGLLLVYLVLASIVPFIMVPVGLIVVLWQVLHSLGLASWITAVSKGPAGKVTTDGSNQ